MRNHEQGRGQGREPPRVEKRFDREIKNGHRQAADEDDLQIRPIGEIPERQRGEEPPEDVREVVAVDVGTHDPLRDIVEDERHLARADPGRAGPEIKRERNNDEGAALEISQRVLEAVREFHDAPDVMPPQS